MAEATRLYKDVVGITQEYFGVAADRFVTRQIQNHLHKRPEQLGKRDLAALVKWISLAMALLTDDEKLVQQYAERLSAMSGLAQD